jgi:hypothetical protein
MTQTASSEEGTNFGAFAVESCKNLPISYTMPVFPRVKVEKRRTNFPEICRLVPVLCKSDSSEVHFRCRPPCVSACILNVSCHQFETCL